MVVNYRLLSFLNPSIRGLTLYPFIILKHKHLLDDKVLINHEKIHIKQQLELLILPFYILYIINYLINIIKYRSHFLAYYNIAFEKEAYNNEYDFHYLKKRKAFAFWNYIK
ncbi:MAG: hypothetical protein CMO01_11020 [Thalassobius sp.]|nr:hypothetical protein [Thalassovita sp.]